MKPGVSFVVTIYNKERFLPDVIGHLRDQASDRPRQFIFVDDGSRDASMKIVRDLTRDWADCEYVEQANGGPSCATNVGIAKARLDYLKLLGSDDLLAPGATDKLIEVMETTAVDMVCGRMHYYRDANEIAVSQDDLRRAIPTVFDHPLASVVRYNWSGTSQTLYRLATVKRAGGCDPRVFVEDFSLALRVALIGRFALLDTTLAFGPAADGDRIMVGLKHQTFHDYGLALYWFLADCPALVPAFGRIAFERAAGRAYKWALREGGSGFPWRYFWLHLASRLPLGIDPVRGIRATLDAFSLGPYAAAHPIILLRDPHAEPGPGTAAA